MKQNKTSARDPWGFRRNDGQAEEPVDPNDDRAKLRKAIRVKKHSNGNGQEDLKLNKNMMDFDDVIELEEINELKLESQQNIGKASNLGFKPQNKNSLESRRHPKLDRIPFSDLVKYYKEVQACKGKQRKEKAQYLINKFFAISRDPAYIFTLIRLILPIHDKSRSNYQLNVVKLAKVIGDVFSLGDDAKFRLKFYKRPIAYGQLTTGDFGEVLQDVLKNLTTSTFISINTIDKTLDDLSTIPNNKEAQVNLLRGVFKFASAEEIKWMCRLILKDLGLQMSHEMVLDLIHPDANMLYNMTSSLWVVSNECSDLNKRQSTSLRLFHPIKPMLAGRKYLKTIEQVLTGKDFIVETKFDGERIQCHLTPNEVKFFTRNSNDYTHIYRRMIDVVRRNISNTIDSCILDGEMIVMNRQTGMAIQFGKNKTIALEREEDDDLTICYKVFDIMFLRTKQTNEFFLMNYTLRDRKKILQQVINVEPHKMEAVLGREHNEVAEILVEFNEAVQNNEEGIVVKQLDTLYYPGDRSEKWIKMKGDYYEGIVDTLDLMIIGGYFGEGKQFRNNNTKDWTDHITHFLVAVAKRVDKSNPQNSIFLPFARVATGFRERDLADIRIKMREVWVRSTQTKKIPSYLIDTWRPSERDRPEAFVNSPANSMIIEVRATEIIQSASFPTNFTLRFPRFEKLRRDKDWVECMSMTELLEMTDTLKKKNTPGSEDEDEQQQEQDDNEEPIIRKKKKGEITDIVHPDMDVGAKKRKYTRMRGKDNKVMAQFEDTDVSNVAVYSQLFSLLVFNIINLPNEDHAAPEEIAEMKSNLEIEIAKHSGKKVQNDSEIVTHYIAAYYDFRVKAIADYYGLSVLSIDWIKDSIKAKKLQDFSPRYIIYAQDVLLQRNQLLYDKYGDPFYKDIEVDELTQILNQMDPSIEELNEIEEKDIQELNNLLQGTSDGIYNGQVFCFYGMQDTIKKNADLYQLDLYIQIKGSGKITYTLDENIDYIVALDYAESENDMILGYLNSHRQTEIISPKAIKEKLGLLKEEEFHNN